MNSDLLELSSAFVLSRVIHVAVELKLAEAFGEDAELEISELAKILNAYDLPYVIRKIENPSFELKEEIFFDALSKGADTFLMKRILHDWDDEVAAFASQMFTPLPRA